MKKIILGAMLLLIAQMGMAQAWSGAGDQKAQLGLNAWGNGAGITASYDYGLSKLISVGAGANAYFSDAKDKTFVYGRVGFHLQETLNLPSQWDIYPGANIGLLGNTFDLGIYVGARYFFNDKFGAFAELGNYGGIGVAMRF